MTNDTPPRILVVEDDDEDALILMNLMRAAQVTWQVTRVALLEHAMRELRNRTFDVVLLDLSLPDSRGHETVLAVEQSAPMTAVVVLSGLNDETMAEEAIRQGAQDYLVKGRIEPRMIARTIRHAIERKRSQVWIAEMAIELEQSNAKPRELVAIDPLTNLPNWRQFEESLREAWARAGRDGTPLALFLLDLDQFRAFNDAQGFLEGDNALRRVGELLRSERIEACRFAGEEFSGLLLGFDRESARAAVERVRAGVALLGVTATAGLAFGHPTGTAPHGSLVARAQECLARAKAAGGNCTHEDVP